MKKKIIYTVLISLALLTIISGIIVYSVLPELEKAEIKFLFDSIKNGESTNNSAYLLTLADKNTHSYFEELYQDVIGLDSISLMEDGIYRQIVILSLRGQISKNRLKQMNGNDLFLHLFKNVTIIPAVIKDRELVDINIKENIATAKINSKMLPYDSEVVVRFTKEDTWKYDFSSYIESQELIIHKVWELSKKPKERYLADVMQAKGVSQSLIELYQPIIKNGD